MTKGKAKPKAKPRRARARPQRRTLRDGEHTSPFGRAVMEYCRAVIDGTITASRHVIRACQRHLDDLAKSENPKRRFPYRFDEVEATRAVEIIQSLKLVSGEFEGQPFKLQPWQLFIVWSLIGWRRAKDGLRRFRDAFITLGRGNGKSPLAAALLIYLAFFDSPAEPRAEVKIAATKRAQAGICFEYVRDMIAQSPALALRVDDTKWSIRWKPNDSTIQPLGKDDSVSGDGFNLHAVVIDELHAWTEQLRPLMEKIDTALGKRRQPLAITITTAGSDRSKLWLEQLKRSSQVLRGVFADHEHFAFIAQIDEAEGELPADDPFDPAVWVKANPNLGVSVNLDKLKRDAKLAKRDPVRLNSFLRYHCNIRVRSNLKPIDLAAWVACGDPLPDLSRRVCYGGLDLGWRDDLASLYLAFPLDEFAVAFKGCSWICEDSNRDLSAEPWRSWIREGWIKVTPGDTTDPEAIYAEVRRLKKAYRLQTIALDRNNAMAVGVHIQNEIGVDIYEFNQSCRKYNEPLRVLVERIKDGHVRHGGDPVLTWAADNMTARSDAAGLMMPDKANSDEKIDPMVASIMALSESLYEPAKPAGYADRGLRSLNG